MPSSLPALERADNRGGQSSRTISVVAPVGGWNTRDPSANMEPKFARVLDNFIPRERDIELRKGTMDWTATAGGFVPRSLFGYTPISGINQLFVASGTGIYDITAGGAIGAAVLTITSPLNWQHINFTVSGGTYLYAANGQQVIAYNGAWTVVDAVSTPAITGVSTTILFGPMAHKRRIWFLQNDSLSTWYLPLNAIGGAATEFPLGPNFRRGGVLVAQGSWTIDAGAGAEDFAVFVTSEGEVAVYSGIDPATDFALKGVYRIPKPIGKRCLQSFGGDLLVLTEEGVYPLSKALQSSTVKRDSAITDRISKSFRDSAMSYGSAAYWTMMLHTAEGLLLVNVPTSVAATPETVQYVMNTTTGAWCRFVGMAAYDMLEFENKFIYSGADRVFLGLTGQAESTGEPIVGESQGGFSYLATPGKQKHVKLVRPQLLISREIQLFLALGVDYVAPLEFQTALVDRLAAIDAAGIWDTSLWDAAVWGFDVVNALEWKTVAADAGFCFSVCVRVAAATTEVRITAFDLLIQDGFVL